MKSIPVAPAAIFSHHGFFDELIDAGHAIVDAMRPLRGGCGIPLRRALRGGCWRGFFMTGAAKKLNPE